MSSESRKEHSGLAGRMAEMRFIVLALLITVEPLTFALTCYRYCELLETGQYAGVIKPECVCSVNDQFRAGELDPQRNIEVAQTFRDAAIYYEPAETNTPYFISFIKQPFYILNPTIKKKYKHSATDQKLQLDENFLSAIDEAHQINVKGSDKQKRKGNYVHKIGIETEELPFYLDIDIHTPTNKESTAGKEILGIKKQGLEQNLIECVDLHILVHSRNSSDVYLKDILSDEKIQKYDNMSDLDLKNEIKNKCKQPAHIINESLNQIKNSWSSKLNKSNTFIKHMSLLDGNRNQQDNALMVKQSKLPSNIVIDTTTSGPKFIETSTEYVDKFTRSQFHIDNNTDKHIMTSSHDSSEIYLSTILPVVDSSLNILNVSNENQKLSKNADFIDSVMNNINANGSGKNLELEYDESGNIDEIENLISYLNKTSKQEDIKNIEDVTLTNSDKDEKIFYEKVTNNEYIKKFESTTPLNLYMTDIVPALPSAKKYFEYNEHTDHNVDEKLSTVTYHSLTGIHPTKRAEKIEFKQNIDYENSDLNTQSSNTVSSFIKLGDTAKQNNVIYENTNTDLSDKIWTEGTYQDTEDFETTTKIKPFPISITLSEKLMSNVHKESTKINYLQQTTDEYSDLVNDAISTKLHRNLTNNRSRGQQTNTSSTNEKNHNLASTETLPIVEKPPKHNQFKLGKVDRIDRVQYLEKDLKIPKIVTKELINNHVVSEINGTELIPNNDYIEAEERNKQDIINSTTEMNNGNNRVNNSDVVGNLFFVFDKFHIPARFVQNPSGELKLGIDGNTFCDKFKETTLTESIIMTTICNCLRLKKCN